MADKSHWISGTHAFAACTTALVALGAFLGFSNRKDDAPQPIPTPTAAAPSPTPTLAPGTYKASQVTVAPVRATIVLDGGTDGTTRLAGTVSVRIANIAPVPLALNWLRADAEAALDLDDGTRIAGTHDSRFTGLPDCGKQDAEDCSASRATMLAPGESTVATIGLSGSIPTADAERLKQGRTGTFSARLGIRPGRDADAYAVPVSVERLRIVNARD
ncbi:MAG: hypothetical protein CMN73_10460 [Sphingomonas sp.]|nr:hypothetical protein [Sphingomonas sp.]|tara:strand:+ start:256 stop:906 length:651 start_codon:yes stop_codon:yes gene_type:complete